MIPPSLWAFWAPGKDSPLSQRFQHRTFDSFLLHKRAIFYVLLEAEKSQKLMNFLFLLSQSFGCVGALPYSPPLTSIIWDLWSHKGGTFVSYIDLRGALFLNRGHCSSCFPPSAAFDHFALLQHMAKFLLHLRDVDILYNTSQTCFSASSVGTVPLDPPPSLSWWPHHFVRLCLFWCNVSFSFRLSMTWSSVSLLLLLFLPGFEFHAEFLGVYSFISLPGRLCWCPPFQQTFNLIVKVFSRLFVLASVVRGCTYMSLKSTFVSMEGNIVLEGLSVGKAFHCLCWASGSPGGGSCWLGRGTQKPQGW